ncbi:putative receptor protein kinase ZmPK1 [Panicum miliaceum]|uniref:Receptor-like serine/threonine-protein kinase n=1 Tax=Panicum miliaceum TaxID=4540 RepID=A0A3L6S034_PANMI|nr:putative receptor protein kinase ZmPK1 [Panicum miliaceum]
MATGQVFALATALLSFLLLTPSVALANDILVRGSSISTGDRRAILVSPNGAFACGFYEVGTNAFTFSVWFSHSADRTVAWTANRDAPVNGNGSRVVFQRSGSLDLLDYDGTAVWSTNTAAIHADSAALLDTGSLVIVDRGGNTLWSSFDSPTDTLLPSQPMAMNARLVSASANGLLSSGFYTLYFDGNYTLSLTHNRTNEISTKYCPTHNQSSANGNRNQYGGLDSKGAFVAGDQLKFEASDLGDGTMRRLTLDYDGNIRMYSLDIRSGSWSISWMLFARRCEIHGLCGGNSLCRYIPELECSCLEGFEMTEPSDWSKGCKRKKDSVASKDFTFTYLPGTDFWGYELNYNMSMPLQKCMKMCLNDGDCQAVGVRGNTGQCYLKTLLFSGKEFPEPNNDIYLKVPKVALPLPTLPSRQSLVCNFTEKMAPPIEISQKKFKFGYFLTSALTLLVVEVTLILIGLWVLHKWKRRPETTDVGSMIIYGQFCRFSYRELQKATNYFHQELGRGGSGVVYKGLLADERKVAVKKLNDMVQGEQEFRSELSVIGRIYHMNVVRIWGFCAEKTHRLLVSEFVEKGSLDRILFDNLNLSPVLQWSQRYNIALGVAKGLAYLHHECLEWIVHCDIKPENILLDEEFEPKIADFGLVKLLGRVVGAQMMSRVHGTRGYIAPEWALNLPITGKADVYSYGVVLLELVMGTRVSSQVVQGEGEVEVEMAVGHYAKILKEKLASKHQSWLLEFVDCRLSGEFDYLQAAMMLKIAVSCVEEERRRRPNMSYVVETLLSLVEE